MKIPEPECSGGYTEDQIEEILGDDLSKFHKWMNGQTMMLCDGRRYDHALRMYKIDEVCAGVAHGPVVYSWDLQRYLGIVPGKDVWD